MSKLLSSLLTTLHKKTAPHKRQSQQTQSRKPAAPSQPKPSANEAGSDYTEARETAREIIILAREEAEKIRRLAKEETASLQASLREIEEKLRRDQAELVAKSQTLLSKQKSLDDQEANLATLKQEISSIKQKELEKLERIGKLTKEQAKEILLDALEKKLSQETAEKIKEAEEKAKEESDEKAKEILVDALYHGATDYVAEYSVSSVRIPDEEIKGRIIGKDGRNIRAFEKATGVDLDMDETPGEIRLSCFDPVRREIAKVALERLMKDGRIQPTRIEEYVAKAKREIDKVIFEEGKKLCHAVGAYNVPHDLMAYLGKFKYRTSYGQNMIAHTLEETKIGIQLASEVGANVETVRLGCLFHDIGKVVNEEGSHVELGVKLLKKYNISQAVVDAVAQHHEDEEYTSIESVLVFVADAISGARPGARYENYEEYITRLQKLEEIAKSKPGVQEAYAIQAGREVRVIVNPKDISDDEIINLARNIKEEIKSSVTYPGTVTVNVIREVRAQEVAK